MSHEMVSADRHVVYTMPAMPSDVLRSTQFHQFFKDYKGLPFLIETNDGWRWSSAMFRPPSFTVTFSSRDELDAVIADSTEDALAKAFLDGHAEVRGDTMALLRVAEYVLRHSTGFSHALIRSLADKAMEWLRAMTGSQDSAVTGWRFSTCRSDLPEVFFRSWLGDSLNNTCPYFDRAEASVEDAHEAAMERMCAALALNEQDDLLDASCGWGSFLAYAAQRHGVTAQGVAFNEEQARIANRRWEQQNLRGLCSMRRDDRAATEYAFSKIADVGMFHQVASERLPQFLTWAHRSLVPGGRLLLHRMTRCGAAARRAQGRLQAEAAALARCGSIAEETQSAEAVGLRIIGMEDWTDPCQKALRVWIERLQHRTGAASADWQRERRSWLFFLVDTAAKLEAGDLQYMQFLYSKNGEADRYGTRHQGRHLVQ